DPETVLHAGQVGDGDGGSHRDRAADAVEGPDGAQAGVPGDDAGGRGEGGQQAAFAHGDVVVAGQDRAVPAATSAGDDRGIGAAGGDHGVGHGGVHGDRRGAGV